MLKPLNEIEIDRPLVDPSVLADYKIPNTILSRLNGIRGELGYSFDSYTAYATTDKANQGKPANYALIPNQYFLFASKLHEFATELYKYFIIFEKLKHFSHHLVGNAQHVIDRINTDNSIKGIFESNEDILLFAKFIDKDDSSYRFGSKRLINDAGSPRGSSDCFGSVILKNINLPDSSSSVFGRLVFDLCANPEIYRDLVHSYENFIESHSSEFPIESPLSLLRLSKGFILLAGISGTGKTRFVREQAAATGDLNETYCLTPVRPDWHEPSDLLGYVSRLNGDPKYVCTDVLEFIVRAWRTIVGSGLSLTAPEPNGRELGFNTTGSETQLDNVPPYWLCLDEMNLAPVEQYFADYLSVLETRQWSWVGVNFRYTCDPLLKASVISQVDDRNILRTDLGLADSAYDNLWSFFCQYGIGIPFNLIVAGTVNMDETTHGFSRKVIDRALSFDFGEFFPNRFDEYFSPATSHKVFTYPKWSQAELAFLPAIDENGQKSITFLRAINRILDQSLFQLAFRALNELLLSVISIEPKDDAELKAVWDDFLMCKILPRIEGDTDKLGTDCAEHTILQKLEGFLQLEFNQFWSGPDNSTESRPDFYRETTSVGDIIHIECRSKRKIQWMQTRLEKSGFTSFWP